jgi:hypothetical protein
MKIRRRQCQHCAQPLPTRARTDARFCSATCRSGHWQRRIRTNRALASRAKCAVCGKRIVFGTRADARYCSTNRRQRIHRQRKRMAPQKAHQRTMRERLTATGTQRTADIRTATVREISRAEATPIVETYEWLGTMPAVTRHCYGIFFAGELGGVVVYGDEAGENLGVWDRYGFTGKIIALARGACLPWAHPHAASKLIRRSMDLLPEKCQIVTASVDAGAGEIGTIYQAVGFVYVGTMRQGGRALVRVNGNHISERQIGRLTGTRGVRALSKLGFDAIPVPRRARYFAFRGHKQERKRNRAAVAHLLKAYPKRPSGSS